MDNFDVVVTFATGDPDTIARITKWEVTASGPVDAAAMIIDQLTCPGSAFALDEFAEVTVTRADPGVARNLLATHT